MVKRRGARGSGFPGGSVGLDPAAAMAASGRFSNLLVAAIQHHQAGRLAEAEPLYRQCLVLDPKHADCLHNLGILAFQTGQHDAAVTLIGRALSQNERLPNCHFNLGVVYHAIQKLAKAEACYRRAIALRSDYAEAYGNLGVVLWGQGKRDQAVASYQRAIALKTDYAEAYCNLGVALSDQGHHEDAVASHRRAIDLRPEYAEAHNNLGNALRAENKVNDAAACYRRAIDLKPSYVEAHINLGAVLRDQGELDASVARFRRAIALNPNVAEAHNNLGSTLMDQGRLEEAEACYRKAISLEPAYAEAHSNLSVALDGLGKVEDAAAASRRAIELRPELAEAHRNLGSALARQGKPEEALNCYRQALVLKPEAFEFACAAELLLPRIPKSRQEISTWRTRYQDGVEGLMKRPGKLADPAISIRSSVSFDLAYQDENDRDLMAALCELFRAKAAGLTYTAAHLSDWRAPTDGRRIRVGFCSHVLHSHHTILKLYQGLIRRLDRSRFEVVVLHSADAKRDEFGARLDQLPDKVIELRGTLLEQQQMLAEAELDALIFPDIGMSTSTYFLAFGRYAPVQAVSWGHPDTTGVDSLDYFISSDVIEPKDARSHYTEQLVCFDRLPCCYEAPPVPAHIADRKTLGLPESGALYGCPQTLFKLHPEFDAVLAEIASGDPDGHIVMLEGAIPVWAELLRRRWAATNPVLLERVIFLPPASTERFMALLANFDVLLDPIHFGSGNSLYEAMVFGTPTVTWPGRFMRGRVVAGAYRQLGIKDAPVVTRLEDYATMALALRRDKERNNRLRQETAQAAAAELFQDLCAVREFEAFLSAAVAAAGRGEKLPEGWFPPRPAAPPGS